MPNDCSNRLTITSTSETEMRDIFHEVITSIPYVNVTQNGKLGIRVEYISAWKPNLEFLESIIHKYKCWIKVDWVSEDGTSGVWVGDKTGFKSLEWDGPSIEDELFLFIPIDT